MPGTLTRRGGKAHRRVAGYAEEKRMLPARERTAKGAKGDYPGRLHRRVAERAGDKEGLEEVFAPLTLALSPPAGGEGNSLCPARRRKRRKRARSPFGSPLKCGEVPRRPLSLPRRGVPARAVPVGFSTKPVGPLFSVHSQMPLVCISSWAVRISELMASTRAGRSAVLTPRVCQTRGSRSPCGAAAVAVIPFIEQR